MQGSNVTLCKVPRSLSARCQGLSLQGGNVSLHKLSLCSCRLVLLFNVCSLGFTRNTCTLIWLSWSSQSSIVVHGNSTGPPASLGIVRLAVHEVALVKSWSQEHMVAQVSGTYVCQGLLSIWVPKFQSHSMQGAKATLCKVPRSLLARCQGLSLQAFILQLQTCVALQVVALGRAKYQWESGPKVSSALG
jgi:hypothetical protein